MGHGFSSTLTSIPLAFLVSFIFQTKKWLEPFLQLSVVHLILFPSIGTDPQSCSKQELVNSSPPCAGLDNLYQTANARWEKEAFSSQSAAFSSGPSPNFSFRIQD